MKEKSTLYLVVPCYNEQEVLEETNRQLLEKMSSLVEKGMIGEKSRIRVFDTCFLSTFSLSPLL